MLVTATLPFLGGFLGENKNSWTWGSSSPRIGRTFQKIFHIFGLSFTTFSCRKKPTFIIFWRSVCNAVPRFCQLYIFASILLDVPKCSRVPRTCWLSPLSARRQLWAKFSLAKNRFDIPPCLQVDKPRLTADLWSEATCTQKNEEFFLKRKRATWVDYMTVSTMLGTIIGFTTQQNQL